MLTIISFIKTISRWDNIPAPCPTSITAHNYISGLGWSSRTVISNPGSRQTRASSGFGLNRETLLYLLVVQDRANVLQV